MTEKAKECLWSRKPIPAFKETGKKALAVLLSAAIALTALPVVQMPAAAEEDPGSMVQDSGYVAGKDGFHVVAYDQSARIEIPFVSGAKNYKVYLSQTPDLTDFSGASCVLSSDTYQSYTYAIDGDKDAANDSKTISIGYSEGGDNTYDFYLVTNDGSTNTVQDSVEVETRSTEDAVWTTPEHYDTGWYGDGSADSFTISTAAQLAGLAVLTNGLNGETATSFTGKTIHLSSSVDLSEYLWTPIGSSECQFSGTFDGGNYDKDGKYTVQNVVTGLHTNDSTKSDQGLFGCAQSNSTIKNIGVVSSGLIGKISVGGIAGYADSVENCYNTSEVKGSENVGGIAGKFHSAITNSYNTGSIDTYPNGGWCMGGVTGNGDENSTISNCYNTGAITHGSSKTGGVAGLSSGSISDAYNTGVVQGYTYVGGVVGYAESNAVSINCYNTGSVSGIGNDVGGIAGCTVKVVACYNTGSVSGGNSYTGGLVGAADTILESYNTGAVISGANGNGLGNYVGGIAGSANHIKNCYNIGAVSTTGTNGDYTAGITFFNEKINSYSAGKVKGTDTYITYNSTGTKDSSATSKSDLISKIDTGSDSAFIASPTEYAHYPNREDIATGVFTSSNSVNQGYPVLRSFGYTDNTDADGFSPATVTIDATNNKVTVGTDYGDGTESKPYIIRNAYQMDLVRSYTQTKDVCFKLAGNVDISPAQYNKTPDENGSWTSSDSWKAIGDQFDHFKGNLDGNHCTISGMFLSSGEVLDDAEGLFAYTVWGTIQDLGTAASNMTANGTRFTYLGSIAGFGSGTIRNCYNAGTVSSYGSTSTCELGGIVGRANYYDDSESAFISTTFENCYNSGTVIGNGNNAIVGGVVGCSDNHLAGVDYQSTLSCCYNSGAVAGSSPENSGTTGGVAGLWSGSFTDSYNVGKVSSTGYAGGVAGRVIAASDTDNIQKNCYNLGTVSNDGTVNVHGDIGGVFGCCGGSSYNSTTGLVSNCYNAGTVYNGGANPTGGVAGGIYYADVQNCYNIGKVNGISGVGGISGSVGIASLQSCYNTGVIDARSQTKGNGIGGIAGSLYGSGKIINCYNTAVIHSSSDKVGGIAGQVESAAETVPPVISTCYNTGTLDIGSGSDMYYVGGIVGNFQSGSVSLCYNIGNVHSRGGIVGNMVVYGASVSKCYYTNTYCGGGFDDSGMTPFISYKSPLDKGSTADMKEVAFADLDPEFKAAFGITAVQYPDGYESSDTNVLTVKDKTVTAVEVGDAEVRGTAGEHSNAKIIISQNALNMTDATSGFNDAGTEKVSNVVGLPVSVVVLPKFTAFSVKTGDGKNHDGTIDNLKNTVLVKVPDGTDVSNLVATFTVNADAGDVYVYADGEEPKSGVTPVDFSTDKTYSISGMSGYRAYTVVVAPESKSLAGMDDYSIKLGNNNYDGVIDEDEKTISVTVPYDTDLTKLVADFSASNGSDVTVGDTAQESGTTENDFSSPVSYDVTGLDDSTATYTVTVACADESEKSLAYFGLYDSDDNEYTGTIDQTKHTISITVPKDTDVTDLTAWFDTYAPSVKVGDDEQESGVTGNDFTDPVTYTVTAADGSTQIYRVIVTAQLPDNAISINLGTASYHTDDSCYHFDDATVDGNGIKTIFINFSNNVTKGESIDLPASEGSFSDFTVSATSNDYAKRINIHDGTIAAAVQEYLRAVSFHMNSVKTIKMVVTSDYIDCDTFYNIDTQHYYQYISFATKDKEKNWIDAYNDAENRTYMGRTGYLATVMNKEEDVFINDLSGGKVGWLGGTALIPGNAEDSMYYDFSSQNGITAEEQSTKCKNYWYWACGPERDTKFFSTRISADHDADDDTDVYHNWNPEEPNNNPNETCLTTLSNVGAGEYTNDFSWNDLAYDNTQTINDSNSWSVKGYFVEYGNLAKGDNSGDSANYGTCNSVIGSGAYIATINAVTDQDTTVTGMAAPGSTVTVKNSNGDILGEATADENGNYSVEIDAQAAETVLSVTATDDKGTSDPVTLKVKTTTSAGLTSYSLTDEDGNTYDCAIDQDKHTIEARVPYGTDVTKLVAEFMAADGATVTVEKVVQESGKTENDFTDPVIYLVKTEDGSRQDYKVTVTVAGETSFQAYSLTDEDGNTYDGIIDDAKESIAVTVPKGTNVKKLTAEFTTSAAVTVEVEGVEQVSGETVNSFTKPVTYTVTAKSGAKQKYKVTVTIQSDHKDDDDDKESSHHHSHSSGSSPKPKKPETKTTVDSEKNTASVSAVASNVRQNGNAAEIQVLVPTITADSSNGKTALDLSKDAAVTIELPKNDIIQQINAGKSANVSLTLPSDARSDGASNLAVSINVAKEILEAAKTSGQDMTLAVRYADDPRAAYTWTFKGDDLAKSGTPLSDVNMDVEILPTAKVPEISSVTRENQGVVVRFSQNGTLPAAATVTFSAQDQGLAANQSMDLYQYDSVSGQLIPTGKEVKVDAFGNTSLLVDNCEDYVLLPDSIRTITLDTRIYTMDIGDSYETGITLLNAPAGSYMKTYSSTDGVAATSMLPNGNVKAVGLKPGLTYVMMDLYDADHHFLTHASIRLIVKADVAKPFGNSNQQFGIY